MTLGTSDGQSYNSIVDYATQIHASNGEEGYDTEAWKAAGSPKDPETGHGPDTFKLPDHITFSDESMYHGKDGNEGGHWSKLADDRWAFTPSMTNLEHHSIGELKSYFKKYEPGNVLNVNLAQDHTKTISDVGEKYGVRPEILTKQLHAESSFDPLTGNYSKETSSAGAQGPAQFMPETAKKYGVDVNDVKSSIEGQGHYMSDLQKKFNGSEGLALAGYNWGEGHVKKWLDAGADPQKMPQETRDYVRKITGRSIDSWVDKGDSEEGSKSQKVSSLSQGTGGATSTFNSRFNDAEKQLYEDKFRSLEEQYPQPTPEQIYISGRGRMPERWKDQRNIVVSDADNNYELKPEVTYYRPRRKTK